MTVDRWSNLVVPQYLLLSLYDKIITLVMVLVMVMVQEQTRHQNILNASNAPQLGNAVPQVALSPDLRAS